MPQTPMGELKLLLAINYGVPDKERERTSTQIQCQN